MENRILVTKIHGALALVAIALLFISAGNVQAKERKEIRFYKINKDELTARIRFTAKKSRKPGCHNFFAKAARLHRTVQFGYEWCKVYSKKGCAEGSEMSFYRTDEPEPTSELSQGFGWYPVGEHKRGEKVRSWQCK